MATIRHEEPKDKAAVRRVNERAFERNEEADLVDALRLRDEPLISMVAVEDEQIVGHILFSMVTIESEETRHAAVALGPLAVEPIYHGKGIGSQLVEAGLEECRKANHELVIVLGHADYYPRFGFVPTKPHGIRWENEVPEEVFMLLELKVGALTGKEGIVKYLPEFDGT